MLFGFYYSFLGVVFDVLQSYLAQWWITNVHALINTTSGL